MPGAMVLFLKSHGLIAVFYNYMPLTSIKMCSHMQCVPAVDLAVWFVQMLSLLLASSAVSASLKIIANMFLFCFFPLCSSVWSKAKTTSTSGCVTVGYYIYSPEVQNTTTFLAMFKVIVLFVLSLCFQNGFVFCFIDVFSKDLFCCLLLCFF